MIAVILFFVVIVVAAILLGNWATKLDKREKAYKKKEQDLDYLQRSYNTNIAGLRAKLEAANKKQKDADDAWQKCLEEGNRLMTQQHKLEAREAEIERREKELANKKADVSTREAILGFMGVPEAPDIIEPVEEPQKVVEKPHSPAYVCPLCGGKMYGRSDGKNTEYVCSDCGYIATAVPTDKKPVKKARKGGKK